MEREKDILIQEFKTLGVKLRRLKDSEVGQLEKSSIETKPRPRPLSQKRGSVASAHYSRDSICDKHNLSLQLPYSQSIQPNHLQSVNHNHFQSVQSNHYQSVFENANSVSCPNPHSCCTHGVSQHAHYSQHSPTSCQTTHVMDNSSASYREILETAEFDSHKAENKQKFLMQLEAQIKQIQEQIKKNEGMLLQKNKEIARADEILQSKRKYIHDEPNSEPVRDRNVCETCSRAFASTSGGTSAHSHSGSISGQSMDFELIKMEKKKLVVYVKETESRLKEEEARLKKKEAEIEEIRQMLRKKEKEIEARDAELKERKERLDKTEQEFQKLAKRLEDQSEELIKQKTNLNQRIEAFTTAYERFQDEKSELAHMEKEFHKKTVEMRLEKERLTEQNSGFYREKNEVERQNYEIKMKLEELERAKKAFDQKEAALIQRELAIEQKCEELRAEIDSFKHEKEDFANTMVKAEQMINEREKQLQAKELLISQNKEYLDDFELKLLGLRMNEEQWQKKRDFEIENLLDDVKRLKQKEISLAKKEEKLMRWEERLRKEEAGLRKSTDQGEGKSLDDDLEQNKENIFNYDRNNVSKKESKDQSFSFHNELADKYLVPLSNRSNRDYHSTNMSDLLK